MREVMDATPINARHASPISGIPSAARRGQFGQTSASALDMQWSALHEAAEAVAALAGIAPDPMTHEARSFPAAIREAGERRRELAEQGIEDLVAIMHSGISALLAALARGADAVPAARALRHEFLAARNALLALSPGGSHRA